MNSIKLLPDKVINQIAAGEVIERPISVVKELFENAVDAGASKIIIRIQNGGKTSISITDNGKGISKDDLALAIERHATSKLNNDNLNLISTHGFRGEALPSIASVSQFSITSMHENADSGYKISVDFGAKSEPFPASHNIGTTVEALNLFAALPARLKFLKSDKVESSHILEFLQHMSLCYTNIDISLHIDHEEAFHSPATQTLTKEKITSIFGEEFAKNMVEISLADTFSIAGYVGLPTFMRNNTATQIFFVNNRLVKDKVLYRAIKVAYQNLMMVGKHAACILKLTFDPYDIDVNAHPAKTEIRFYEADKVISKIAAAVRNTLSMTHAKPNPQPHSHNYQPSFRQTFASERPAPSYAPPRPQEQAVMQLDEEIDYPLGFAVMQVNNSYIIAKSKNGLILVDQHAAHERVNLEKFKAAARNRSVAKQHLTVPIIVDLPQHQLSSILSLTEQLAAFGFDVERNGLTQLALHSLPTIFKAEHAHDFIHSLASDVENSDVREDYKKFFDAIIGNVACKLSIKAGDKMSLSEMNNLLRDIEKAEFGGECNHGRPTFLLLDDKELAKLFYRI